MICSLDRPILLAVRPSNSLYKRTVQILRRLFLSLFLLLTASSALAADITGRWNVTITSPEGRIVGVASFAQKGHVVTGWLGPSESQLIHISTSLNNDTLTIWTHPEPGRNVAFARCDVKVGRDRMTGTIDFDKGTIEFVRVGMADAQDSVLPFVARSILTLHRPMIIAVGESSHGAEPMLLARNRLVRELAEEGRISWVALETGYAEALLLDHYVRGGSGTPADVAAKGFTWGFGNLAGNVALLEELRTINLGKPGSKQIGIVGIDLSLGGPLGSAPMMAPVACALDGVRDPALRESLRASFSRAVLPGLGPADVPEQAKSEFRALSVRLTSSMDHDAPESARQCTLIVTESAAAYDLLPKLTADHSMPPDAWRGISARDDAMAKNAMAALAHAEGGNILLFAHTSHILNASMSGRRFSGQIQPPESMGEILQRSLGNRYLAIAQVEPVKPTPSSPPPDLLLLLHPECEAPCMVRADKLQPRQVRIGINGDDQELIDPMTAASFYVIVPNRPQTN
jgi:erythromycin esterase-like protein